MKRLIIVLTLVSTPALSGEYFHDWNDEFKKGEDQVYRSLTTPVTPSPMASSPEYQPRGVETLHPYTYMTPEGDTGNVYLQRRD